MCQKLDAATNIITTFIKLYVWRFRKNTINFFWKESTLILSCNYQWCFVLNQKTCAGICMFFSWPPCKIPEAHSGANNGQKSSDSNKQYRACAYLTGWVLISVVEPKLEKKTAGSGLLGAGQQSAERSSLKKTVICLTSQCLTCIIFWISQENNLN